MSLTRAPLAVDANDLPIVVNDGAAAPASALHIAGSDGANLRALLTDTSGRQEMVGAAADGAAVAGNPVLIAGQDGANVQSLLTDANGRLEVNTQITPAGTGTTSSVPANVANVTILAANANRLGATIVNDGNANLYLKMGATASLTDFTVKVPANGYYEVPFNYTGIIDGIWNVANGNARVTEFTT